MFLLLSGTHTSASNSAYPLTDGIPCDSLEHTTVHYHLHVSIYIDGKATQIPQNVGIADDQSCYYWLHTHDATGIIHVEAPSEQDLTLGNFFDIWQRSNFSNLGTGYPKQLNDTGWTTYVDGKSNHDNQRSIVLAQHNLITLAFNSPGVKPDTTYNWGDL